MRLLFLTSLAYAATCSKASIFFDIEPVDEAFLTEAKWIFESVTDLPVSVDDCWDIITSDASFAVWCPEVSDIMNMGEPGVGNIRTIVYDDFVLNLLALGAIGIEETFDIWEDTGDTRRYSLFFSAATRPNFYSWEAGREEFKCETLNATESRFTRTLAVDPGILSLGLGAIVKPRIEKGIGKTCPNRLIDAIAAGELPL